MVCNFDYFAIHIAPLIYCRFLFQGGHWFYDEIEYLRNALIAEYFRENQLCYGYSTMLHMAYCNLPLDEQLQTIHTEP